MRERQLIDPGKRAATILDLLLYDPAAGLFNNVVAAGLKLR